MILTKYTRGIQLHVGLIIGLHVIVLSILSYPFFMLVCAIFCTFIGLRCQYDWITIMEEHENDNPLLINNSGDSMTDGILSN
jgi:hypothetical protein